ncbi:hypothetical protein NMY22_g9055 [Coprinellus aureogranulatus]|nr:hypothetical protein NMY22_g9055 [Coprinellus aureogranulatus]
MLAAERKCVVLISGTIKNSTPEQKAVAIAVGYYHTYFDIQGLDLYELARMPGDQQLAFGSDAASQETSGLLAHLWISLERFLASYTPPPNVRTARPSPAQGTLAPLISLYDSSWRTSMTTEKIIQCEFAPAADSTARLQEIESLPEKSPRGYRERQLPHFVPHLGRPSASDDHIIGDRFACRGQPVLMKAMIPLQYTDPDRMAP